MELALILLGLQQQPLLWGLRVSELRLCTRPSDAQQAGTVVIYAFGSQLGS
jgi:hypothetical protein